MDAACRYAGQLRCSRTLQGCDEYSGLGRFGPPSWPRSAFPPRAPTTRPIPGSVARTIAEDARTGTTSIRFPLCSAVEHAGDEDRLCSDIAPVDISNLTLPDHRHRLETCQRSPRRSETAEAQSRPDQSLDAPVILLDDVVQVLALPQTGAAQSSPSLFISATAFG